MVNISAIPATGEAETKELKIQGFEAIEMVQGLRMCTIAGWWQCAPLHTDL